MTKLRSLTQSKEFLKIIKQNQNVLKNKELYFQEIVSITNDKNQELEALELLNAKDIDSNDEVIRSRKSEIDKYGIEIAQLKINKKDKSKTTKEKVLEWVSADNSSIQWPTKILKSGPNKGLERICNEAYDMADAYVIGKSFLIENI